MLSAPRFCFLSAFRLSALLRCSLHRNVSILSKRKSEERREVRTASRDEEVSVRRPPDGYVGLAISVIIANDGFVSRRTKDGDDRTTITALVDPP